MDRIINNILGNNKIKKHNKRDKDWEEDERAEQQYPGYGKKDIDNWENYTGD